MSVATSGMGHTRWATHGVPVERNAHPHRDNSGRLAIIHNGIIENYAEVKRDLADKGYTFASETDTEVLANLISEGRKHTDTVLEALAWALEQVEGAYAVVVVCLDEPGVIFAARQSSPLVFGQGQGENFVRGLGHPGLPSLHPRRGLPGGRRAGAHGRQPVGRVRPQDPRARGQGNPPYHLGRAVGPQGRLQALHAQGDLRAAPGGGRLHGRTRGHGPGRHPPARARRHGPAQAPDHRGLRHLVPRRAVGARSSWSPGPGCPCAWRSPRNSAIAT